MILNCSEPKLDSAMAKKDQKTLTTHKMIVLCLEDKVLRKVSKEKTAKLESLYMTKSLLNCLYLKQVLYSYK